MFKVAVLPLLMLASVCALTIFAGCGRGEVTNLEATSTNGALVVSAEIPTELSLDELPYDVNVVIENTSQSRVGLLVYDGTLYLEWFNVDGSRSRNMNWLDSVELAKWTLDDIVYLEAGGSSTHSLAVQDDAFVDPRGDHMIRVVLLGIYGFGEYESELSAMAVTWLDESLKTETAPMRIE